MIPILNRRPTLWTIPAFLIGFGLATFLCQPSKGIIYNVPDARQCYYRGDVGANGTDHQLVTLTVAGPNTYDGVFNFVPAEKDSARGFWHGVVTEMPNGVTRIVGLATMSGEGQISTEQKIFQLVGDTLSIGYGELVPDNNIYVLANPNQVQFSSDILTKTDCADVPVEAL